MENKCVVLMIENQVWGLKASECFKNVVKEIIICSSVNEIPTKHLDLILYEPIADKFTNNMFFTVRGQHPDTPIVCYTTIQNMQDHEILFESDFDAIILKPITIKDFKNICCTYLSRCVSNKTLLGLNNLTTT